MPLPAQLIESLQAIDSDWALLPIDGRKRPVDPLSGEPLLAWGNSGLDLEAITALAGNPYVHAVGVLLGPASGVLALDFDGRGAAACFRRIYGRSHRDLPPTVGWSSGLPHRGQLAFRVPRESWDLLRGRRRWTGAAQGGKARTVFELRWAGHQSVIAGVHPETGHYRWMKGCSPDQVSVADAPEWLLEPLYKQPDEPVCGDYAPTAADVPRALDLLQHIPPLEDYEGWLTVGMALHSVDPGLLAAWVEWSRGCAGFDEAECLAKWRSFKGRGVTIGSLHHHAAAAGYHYPWPAGDGPRGESLAREAPAAGPQPLPEPARDAVIARLLEQLLDLLLETRDTWAEEQAIRSDLWSLGVTGQAIDERIYYALAYRWELPLQNSHNGGSRNRRLSDPITSPAEDLLPGFLLWRRDHLLFGAGGSGKTMAAAAMAVCCIKGLPFLDQEIPPSRSGRVLWIGTDGGEGARAMVREYLEDLGCAEDPCVD